MLEPVRLARALAPVAAAAPAATAGVQRASLVDRQRTAHQILAIAVGDGPRRHLPVADFRKNQTRAPSPEKRSRITVTLSTVMPAWLNQFSRSDSVA